LPVTKPKIKKFDLFFGKYTQKQDKSKLSYVKQTTAPNRLIEDETSDLFAI